MSTTFVCLFVAGVKTFKSGVSRLTDSLIIRDVTFKLDAAQIYIYIIYIYI